MADYLKGLSRGASLDKKPKRSKFSKVFLRGVKEQLSFNSLYLLNLIKIIEKNRLHNRKSKLESINIYDIGCGPCDYLFSNIYDGIKLNYIGVDRNLTYEDYINRIGGKLIKANLEKKLLMIESESADLIICSHVIEHINNFEQLISEMKRILRPEGLIFFRTPDIENVGFTFYRDYTHVSPFTPNALKDCLINSDLKLIYSKSITPLSSISKIIIKRLPLSLERTALYLIGIISQLTLRRKREVEALAQKME